MITIVTDWFPYMETGTTLKSAQVKCLKCELATVLKGYKIDNDGNVDT